MADASTSRPGHERSDASPRLIAMLAGGLAIFLALAPILLFALYPGAISGTQGVHLETVRRIPAPKLQVSPERDLAAMRTFEQHRLTTFGWVNPNAGLVRMPIDRAIALIEREGIPGWPKP